MEERRITGTLYEFIHEAFKEISQAARDASVYPEDIVIEAKVYPVLECPPNENKPRLSILVPRVKEELSCNTFSAIKVKFNVSP